MSGNGFRQFCTCAAARLLALLLFAVLPQVAHAYKAAFEGALVSNNPTDPPLAIVLKFESNLAGVYGTVRLRMPGASDKPVTGYEIQGTCDMRGEIGEARTLQLKGMCSEMMKTFEGTYSITQPNQRRQSGIFRLTKSTDKGNRKDTSNRRASAATSARCTNANTACLIACPRGDYDAELLCANRCRAKLAACKAGKQTTDRSSPAEKP